MPLTDSEKSRVQKLAPRFSAESIRDLVKASAIQKAAELPQSSSGPPDLWRNLVPASIFGLLGGVQAPKLEQDWRRWRYMVKQLSKRPQVMAGPRSSTRSADFLRKTLRPFDVVVTTNIADWAPAKDWVNKIQDLIIGAQDHHSYVVVPGARPGDYRFVPVGLLGGGRPRSAYPTWSALQSTLARVDVRNPTSLRRWPKRFWDRRQFLKKLRDQPFMKNDNVLREVGRAGFPLSEFLRTPAHIKVLRKPGGLSAAERERLVQRVKELGRGYALEQDAIITGLRNFLFGHGDVSKALPSACSGGVCSLYRDIIPLGHPGATLPGDITSSGKFKEVTQLINTKSTNPKAVRAASKELRRRGVKQLRRLVGARGVAFGLPLLLATWFLGRGPSKTEGFKTQARA